MVLFEKEKKQLWVFVSLEPQSKFWVNFELGSRTNHTANRLVMGWKEFIRWTPGKFLKVTTDKLADPQKCFREAARREVLCLSPNS